MYRNDSQYQKPEWFNKRLRVDAFATLQGGPLAPNLKGLVWLHQLKDGVYIQAYVYGMPITLPNGTPSSFHGFHIHEFGNCTVGDPINPFLASGNHWNPTNQPHPFHAGDLPPLLSNNGSTSGSAVMSVMTNRFVLKDAVGRAIIIHQNPDDFVTQPSGNSGPRWACGVINAY